MWKFVTIHGGQNHGSTEKYVLDYKWSLIGGSPFSPGITLRQYDALDYHIPYLILLLFDFLVEGLDHPFLIHLTMADNSKSFLVD